MAWPSVNSQPFGGGQLASLLATLAAQGQRQRYGAYQQIGGGLQEMLEGFQRRAEIGRQRDFTAKQAQDERDFRERQERNRLATEGARIRRAQGMDMMRMREEKRQFDVSQANVGEQRLRDDLAALERIAADYAQNQIPIPPALAAHIDGMRQKVLGFGSAPAKVPQGAPAGGALASVLGPGTAAPTTGEQQRAFTEAADIVAPPSVAPKTIRDIAPPRQAVNRIINTIGKDAPLVFGQGIPEGRFGKFYKLIVSDIEDGVTDPGRLAQRAKDRLGDTALIDAIFGPAPKGRYEPYDTEISSAMPPPRIAPPRDLPTEQDIATFVNVALKRLGKN